MNYFSDETTTDMEIVRNACLDKYKKVLVNNPPKILSVFFTDQGLSEKTDENISII